MEENKDNLKIGSNMEKEEKVETKREVKGEKGVALVSQREHCRGGTLEKITTGVHDMHTMFKNDKLKIPASNVNNSVTKSIVCNTGYFDYEAQDKWLDDNGKIKANIKP